MMWAPLLCWPQEAGQRLRPSVAAGQLRQGGDRDSYQGAACNEAVWVFMILHSIHSIVGSVGDELFYQRTENEEHSCLFRVCSWYQVSGD